MCNGNCSKSNGKEIKVIKEIGTISSSRNAKTSVRLLDINGKQYVDIRKLWIPEEEEEFRPTKKGIALTSDSFCQLEKMMVKIREEFKVA